MKEKESLNVVNDQIGFPKIQIQNMKNKFRILVVFGTRPEAIKMAPLVKQLLLNNKVETIVCVTAQHRQLLDQVLDIFKIHPHYDLNLMQKSQDLFQITTNVLNQLKEILEKVEPNLVLVHGDTSTSMAAALASFYKKIPVGHVEAGLRTYNLESPWPEEANRQITSRIAQLNFAPTEINKGNLLKEGIAKDKIYVTGNTVIDALTIIRNKIKCDGSIKESLIQKLIGSGINDDKIKSWGSNNRKLILITAHRRENFGNNFLNIFKAIKALSLIFTDVDFVFPMHLNPNLRKAFNEVFDSHSTIINNSRSNLYFIEPIDYISFVCLMELTFLILTDSGGVQEEAPMFGIPVLVMRDTTERPEAIASGCSKLIGAEISNIIEEVSRLITDTSHYQAMSHSKSPYGDGFASQNIVNIILNFFNI
jgi:UDP-N-acetylglucosamine 2-epimerase (non-hydrolysing)